MDMRSLNTSLPRASPKQATPPEQLLQAFKDAALSVTKLYKTAAADQTQSKQEGYQDCLDDLLAFMDKANIGLSDGEGWKIREWATQRLDGRETQDSDEDSDKDQRASSPVVNHKQPAQVSVTNVEQTPATPVEIPETIIEEPVTTPPSTQPIVPPTGNFSFRSNIAYPQEAEMSDDNNHTPMDSSIVSQPNSPAVTFARRRDTNRSRNNRHNNRTTSNSHNRRAVENATTGSKRKINFGEFFDIGDSLNPFGGGGKRTRFT